MDQYFDSDITTEEIDKKISQSIDKLDEILKYDGRYKKSKIGEFFENLETFTTGLAYGAMGLNGIIAVGEVGNLFYIFGVSALGSLGIGIGACLGIFAAAYGIAKGVTKSQKKKKQRHKNS